MSNGSKTYWVTTEAGVLQVRADHADVRDGELEFFRGNQETGFELIRAFARGEWSNMSEASEQDEASNDEASN